MWLSMSTTTIQTTLEQRHHLRKVLYLTETGTTMQKPQFPEVRRLEGTEEKHSRTGFLEERVFFLEDYDYGRIYE